MVANIRLGPTTTGAIAYNERKVNQGKARLIDAVGYLKDGGALSIREKKLLMDQYTSLHERAEYKCFHTSLNFHPSELLNPVKLRVLAAEYMERIGFGDQPYLLYQHFDAAHPHVHIVAPTINAAGDLLELNFIGKYKSKPATQFLEIKYDLVRADKKKQQQDQILPAAITAAQYSKAETYRQINRVVRSVWRSYKFTNLAQFDAVLRQYGVTVDAGPPGSVMAGKGGLRYSIIGTDGLKTGVSIKASRLTDKPVLRRLQQTFLYNKQPKERLKDPLRRTIADVLHNPAIRTKADFARAMASRQVQVIYLVNPEGRTYGLTLIDNINRVCFKGSELGKDHSIAGIERRLQTPAASPELLSTPSVFSQAASSPAAPLPGPAGSEPAFLRGTAPPEDGPVGDLIYYLLRYEYQQDGFYDPYRKRRKKPGKEQSL